MRCQARAARRRCFIVSWLMPRWRSRASSLSGDRLTFWATLLEGAVDVLLGNGDVQPARFLQLDLLVDQLLGRLLRMPPPSSASSFTREEISVSEIGTPFDQHLGGGKGRHCAQGEADQHRCDEAGA